MTTIDLIEPRDWHGEAVRRLKMKPPTAGMLLKLGEPRLIVRNADGAVYFVEKEETIAAYIDRLVDHEGGKDFVSTLCLADGKQVKAVLFDFFQEADAAILKRNLPPSSSTSRP